MKALTRRPNDDRKATRKSGGLAGSFKRVAASLLRRAPPRLWNLAPAWLVDRVTWLLSSSKVDAKTFDLAEQVADDDFKLHL